MSLKDMGTGEIINTSNKKIAIIIKAIIITTITITIIISNNSQDRTEIEAIMIM